MSYKIKTKSKVSKAKIYDLTNYNMPVWDGVQYYSKKEAEKKIKDWKLKNRAVVVKDKKPSYYTGKWKQTYTIREKERNGVQN